MSEVESRDDVVVSDAEEEGAAASEGDETGSDGATAGPAKRSKRRRRASKRRGRSGTVDADDATGSVESARDDTAASAETDDASAGEASEEDPSADVDADDGPPDDDDGAARAASDEDDEGDGGDDEDSDEDEAASTRFKAKIQMPRAQDIARGDDFVPHAVGAAARAAGRPRSRKARRRNIFITIGIVVALAAGGTSYLVFRPGPPTITVTGAFGEKAKINIPDEIELSKKLKVKTLTHGKGAPVAKGDMVIGQVAGYATDGKTDHKVLDSFGKGTPPAWKTGQFGLPGVDKSLNGTTVGSRVLITVPPEDGLGARGQRLGIDPGDTLVVVVDVLGAYPKNASAHGEQHKAGSGMPKVTDEGAGKAPKVKIPKSSPPDGLKTKTLIQGGGPAVRKGQLLVAQYTGVVWRNGKVFDSSYKHGAVATFPIGEKKVISAWDKALVGKKAGSRVLLVVPPKEGYGKKGNPQVGIKGDDTLVFVVDILGSY